jgi:Ca2+-binding EF-hand superfamily protein
MALLWSVSPVLAANDDNTGPATLSKDAKTDGAVLRVDRNKETAVDRVEWKAAQEKRFNRLDKDRDGNLTESEVLATRDKKLTESQEKRRSAAFKRADINHDGRVNLSEFVAGRERPFARCGKSKDGNSTSQECRKGAEGPR